MLSSGRFHDLLDIIQVKQLTWLAKLKTEVYIYKWILFIQSVGFAMGEPHIKWQWPKMRMETIFHPFRIVKFALNKYSFNCCEIEWNNWKIFDKWKIRSKLVTICKRSDSQTVWNSTLIWNILKAFYGIIFDKMFLFTAMKIMFEWLFVTNVLTIFLQTVEKMMINFSTKSVEIPKKVSNPFQSTFWNILSS